MNLMAIVWLIVFVVAAALFFVLASVITVLGFRDLLDLLAGATKRRSDASIG